MCKMYIHIMLIYLLYFQSNYLKSTDILNIILICNKFKNNINKAIYLKMHIKLLVVNLLFINLIKLLLL